QFEKSIEEYSLNPNKATLDEVIYNTFLVFAVMLHEHQHFQNKRLKDEKGNIEIGDVLDKKLWGESFVGNTKDAKYILSNNKEMYDEIYKILTESNLIWDLPGYETNSSTKPKESKTESD